MPASLQSVDILLIDSDTTLRETISQYLPDVTVASCSSFEEAVTHLPLHGYGVVNCPQRIASRNEYALLVLNRHHSPCTSFMVTTESGELACVQRAINEGALGFLHGTENGPTISRIIRNLLSPSRVNMAVKRRQAWISDFQGQLRKNLILDQSNLLAEATQDNRAMCKESLNAIESSMKAMRGYAGDLTAEAKWAMFET